MLAHKNLHIFLFTITGRMLYMTLNVSAYVHDMKSYTYTQSNMSS